MKRVFFNKDYNITEHVLKGEVTMFMERVAIPRKVVGEEFHIRQEVDAVCMIVPKRPALNRYIYPQFEIDQVVAIAQPYKDIPEYRDNNRYIDEPGYDNRDEVKPWLMPHHIQIKSIEVMKLYDIPNDYCLKAGIIPSKDREGMYRSQYGKLKPCVFSMTPQGVLAEYLNDRKGPLPWNNWFWVYDFELID